MPERDAGGLSRLDVDRQHSMADEGGASAAKVEKWRAPVEPWSVAATGVACLIGVAAGLALVRLLRSR